MISVKGYFFLFLLRVFVTINNVEVGEKNLKKRSVLEEKGLKSAAGSHAWMHGREGNQECVNLLVHQSYQEGEIRKFCQWAVLVVFSF